MYFDIIEIRQVLCMENLNWGKRVPTIMPELGVRHLLASCYNDACCLRFWGTTDAGLVPVGNDQTRTSSGALV